VVDWAEIVRAVALDLAPLIAQQQLDFEIDTVSALVRAHEWALRELTRNLLHNAIKSSRPQGHLGVRLGVTGARATLCIADSGPGITPELRRRLFQPFASGDPRSGSGLGLAICQEIVGTLGGEIRLDNRSDQDGIGGLDAVVSLPLADNPAS
jgi:two-component system sensor histidine kinase TctE